MNRIVIASNNAGKLREIRDILQPLGFTVVSQREAGVSFELYFQKKIAGGFFGGEGFIMQKFSGNGMLFLEIDGSTVAYDLAAGQSLLVDTGNLAAMEATCSIDVQAVKGIGNVLLGGEGLFNTKVTGPGRIWLQTMPISNMASAMARVMPSSK